MLICSLKDMGKRENFTQLAADIDATGEFPHHLIPKYAEMGLIGMTLSPEYGG
ncbi:MAG: butyryl-CoA dehydrogenase, partial [Desulfobacterales bacterium CG23_combo_of_CG06-09_8_20_14_all_51_8]